MNWYKYSKSYYKYLPLLAVPAAASIPFIVNSPNNNDNDNKTQETKQLNYTPKPQEKATLNNDNYLDKNKNNTNLTVLKENTKPIDNKQLEKANNIVSNQELYPILEINEGKRNYAYYDSLGHKTIGIGFCLETKVRRDAKSVIESVGADYEKVYNGEQTLSNFQIYSLLDKDINNAKKIANSFSQGLENHPKNVQIVLIDMALNIGPKLNNFVKMKQAILNKDYNTAATEMKDSKWFKQIGNRGPRMINIMLGK